MSQNYSLQKNKEKVFETVTKMSTKSFSDNTETAEKIKDAMKCISQLFGSKSQEMTNFHSLFSSKYTHYAAMKNQECTIS